MKEWPKNKTEIVYYGKLVDPVKKIFNKFFKQTKEITKDIPYAGYNIGEDSLATNLDPVQKLKQEALAWAIDEHGEDLADQLFNIIFNLGMEQGRRQERKTIINRFIGFELALRELQKIGFTIKELSE